MIRIADMHTSSIGFGAWAIGGSGSRWTYGPSDDSESLAAIRCAVESGVNWIDTAPLYGLGHSEELVGKAIASMPEEERPYVFSKVGLVWDEADPLGAPLRIMRPDSVRREVEASLRRLGVERIDLCQVHWPGTGEPLEWAPGGASADAIPLEEYWAVMADLKREGKVRAIGLCNHDTVQLQKAEDIAHVDAVQPPFSALNRTAAAEVAWARERGIAVIAHSPMHSGLLTGTFSEERVAGLPADDWRRGHPDFAERLAESLKVADALRAVAQRREVPVAAVAVAWVLAWPGITGAIVGARTPAQVEEWAQAGELELSVAERGDIAQVLQETAGGAGPVQP